MLSHSLRSARCAAELLALAITLAVSPLTRAEEPAAAPPAPAAAPEPRPLALSRHDVARWTERIQPLTDAATQAGAVLDAANKKVAEAKEIQAAADKAVTESAAALTAAEQAKATSDKALADAREALQKTETEKKDDQAAIDAAKEAVDAATKAADEAGKQVAAATEKKKQTEAAKVEADKGVPAAEAGVKPATDAKAAADKVLAEAQAQVKLHQDRLGLLEKGPVKPDPAATRLIQTITHDRPVMSCRFDLQGDYLFAGAQDACLHRWDLFNGAAAHPKTHLSWLGALAIAPSGATTLLAGGHEGKLSWWNGLDASFPSVRNIDAHKGYIRAVAISPDGTLVATGGNDNLVRVWSTADGSLVKELSGHARHVYNVAFHPSGKALVSGDLMGIVKQWEVGSWNAVRDLDAKVLSKFDEGFRADCGGVRSFAFSADGKHLAAGGITEVTNAFAGVGVPCVVLFDWESGKQLKVMKPKEGFQGSIYAVRFSPEGDFVVGAGGGGAGGMWFWKLDDDKSFHAMGLPSVAYDMDLHPDGLRLAVALFDRTVKIYDMSPKVETAQAPAQPAK